MGIIDKTMAPPAEEMPPEGMPLDAAPPEQEQAEEPTDPEGYDKFMLVIESALADKKSKLVEKIAKAIDSAADLPRILATATYDLVAAIDEKTGGIVDDEDLPQAAAETLEHVAGIAEARGKDVSDQVIAKTIDIMLRRFMEEAGDVEGLQRMSQIPPDQVVAEMGQQGPAEEAPAQEAAEEQMED